MKLLALFLLVSCVESKDKIELDSNLPLAHPCNYYLASGWKIDTKKCALHLDNPKYKIGAEMKVVNNRHDSSCRFTVRFPAWSPVKNSPYYVGELICGQHKRPADMLESELQ